MCSSYQNDYRSYQYYGDTEQPDYYGQFDYSPNDAKEESNDLEIWVSVRKDNKTIYVTAEQSETVDMTGITSTPPGNINLLCKK